MTTLVCIPYFGCAPWVERAVRSVLAQTVEDLACVVIGDGEEPPLAHIRDSRLVVHTYARNRGPYFAQDVAIWASPFEWFAPVAADDWLDPEHLEKLLAHGTDVACGALWYHNDRHDGLLIRKLYEVGIYRTERYREIGAHNPNERIGQDSLTIKVMRIVAPMGATTEPTYHRLGRPGSLSTHPDTARDSPARIAMRERNRVIVRRCKELRRPDLIRRYRDSLIPRDVADALGREVELMREKLGVEVAA